MFCTKCKYNSFDHLAKCPKCGFDWKEAREALQLAWLQSEGYNWFQHSPPKTAADTVAPQFIGGSSKFQHSSANAALGTTGAIPDGSHGSPLLIEEVTLIGLEDEKSLKETEDLLAIRKIQDEPILKGTEKNAPAHEQPDPGFPIRRENTVLAEEIIYDFSAFAAKTPQLSDADSSKSPAAGELSRSNEDERP